MLAVVDRVTIDFIINAVFDATQTQMEFFWLAAVRGMEPKTTITSRAVAKIAKRCIGGPPDGGYGVGAIKFLKTSPGTEFRDQWLSDHSNSTCARCLRSTAFL